MSKNTFCQDDFNRLFPNEEASIAAVERARWGQADGSLLIVSPFTGSTNVIRYGTRPRWYIDRSIHRRFSIKNGTYMENSKLSVHKWMQAIYAYVKTRTGISSYELADYLGVRQATAWHVRARLASCIRQEDVMSFEGTLECDECFIGGSDMWRHEKDKWAKEMHSRDDKAQVIGIKQRSGLVWVKHVPASTRETVLHEIVHSKREYVNGNAHTNGIDGFWGMLKTQLQGTYGSVSQFHLQKYVDEKAFQQNTRRMSLKERFELFLSLTGFVQEYKGIINSERISMSGEDGKKRKKSGRIKEKTKIA